MGEKRRGGGDLDEDDDEAGSWSSSSWFATTSLVVVVVVVVVSTIISSSSSSMESVDEVVADDVELGIGCRLFVSSSSSCFSPSSSQQRFSSSIDCVHVNRCCFSLLTFSFSLAFLGINYNLWIESNFNISFFKWF